MTYTAEAPPRPARLDPDLLAASPGGLGAVAAQVRDAIEVASSTPRAGGPLPAGRPGDVLAAATGELGLDLLPEDGIGATAALQAVASVLARYGIDLSHPASAAHLQPPALAVAVAADTLASATNASLDTYDSGPATIAVERQLIGSLARLARLGPHADGVFTPGGSLSNLLALLLARDAAAARLGIDVRSQGVAALPRPVVFCSEIAHFSVHRACAALGLGEDAVVPVPVDATHRMRPDALDAALRELGDATPIAVVATAGSTDFGSIDPLPQIAGV